jgi:hypothetical protein
MPRSGLGSWVQGTGVPLKLDGCRNKSQSFLQIHKSADLQNSVSRTVPGTLNGQVLKNRDQVSDSYCACFLFFGGARV